MNSERPSGTARWTRDRLMLSTFTGLRRGDDPAVVLPLLRELGLTHLELNTPLEYRAQDLPDADLEAALVEAQHQGLGVFLTSHAAFTGNASPNEPVLRKYVERWTGYPAVAGYYLWDEPRLDDFAAVRRTADLLRTLDPERLTLTALLPSYGPYGHPDAYASYVHRFVEMVNPAVLSFDYYPCRLEPETDRPLVWPGFFHDLSVYWAVAASTGKPFWYYAACCGWPTKAGPNAVTIGVQVWAALAFGASGIQYFMARDFTGELLDFVDAPVVGTGERGPTFETVRGVNLQAVTLWPWLQGLEPTGVRWHVAGGVSGSLNLRTPAAGATGLVISEWARSPADPVELLFVVNPDLHDTRQIPPALADQATVLFHSADAEGDDVSSTPTLRPGSACLLRPATITKPGHREFASPDRTTT